MQDKFEILVNDDNKMVGIAPVVKSKNILEDIALHNDEIREFKLITNEAYRNQWLSARRLAFNCKQLIKKEKVKEILKNEVGRPYLKESSLHISLSHNQNIAAVMFSTESCGIDVELFREKIIRVQRKFLNKDELEAYSDEVKFLTLIWSAKESIYKMLGIPGLIFKEQINCIIHKIDKKGTFESEVTLPDKTIKRIPVSYRVFEKELITFCQSGNTL